MESKKDRLAKVGEAAEHLGLSRAKLYQMMEAGELTYVKIGRNRRIRWSELEALVTRCTVTR
jgi:excisionase family DNA binding protein